MSYGCEVSVVNLTNHHITLDVSLVDPNNWENSTTTPTQFNSGPPVEKNSSREIHVEMANGQSSGKFVITFNVDTVGTVQTLADVYPVIEGGNRKGYLMTTGGYAANKFWVLEAQYPKQSWDKYSYDWRHLSLIVLPKIDPRNWMSRLDDNARLNDCTIPGTHDTGTAAIVGGYDRLSGSRVCQGLSISEQLNIGIRFLDIRLNKSRNWEIMHEGSSTGLFFVNDCLRPIMDFLGENSKETVLLCIKDEHGTTDGFHDGILEMLNKAAPSYTFTGHVPPKLSELRGKVVLLRRYWIDPNTNTHKVDDPDSGIDLTDFWDGPSKGGNHYDWPPNSDTFHDVPGGKVFFNYPGNLPFAIQDWYDIHDSYLATKMDLVKNYIDAAKNPQQLPDAWFINFSSCCTTTRNGFPKDFAVGEENMNDFLFLYAITRGKGRYGIIPMDFAGNPPEEATVNLLINSNWLKE